MAKAGGDLGAARASYEKSLELRTALAKADPKNGQLKVDLASSHASLVRLALKAKDKAAARIHRGALKAILDQLDQEGLFKGDAFVAKLRTALGSRPP